ncbi:PREDICTED: DCN1-like protein 3 [Priapulus caudatus]|uniref:Defective in cullin neddylation protein n=1 Tax=Priapulus caudatus TaxID=37621 RepID=A0ABM1DU27_PRICU|nr:PREDICTED: DCN1-like protein 3 [Priapulus caudatus]
MGKCLSCCADTDVTEGCRHTSPTGVTSVSQSSLPSTTVLQFQPQQSTKLTQQGDTYTNGTGNAPLGGDKQRMFPYPRIPPIHRSGDGGKKAIVTRDMSEARIAAIYERYRDPHEDAILSEGVERLCRDLGVQPEEFRVLVLAWKFQAATMCRFTRSEFASGCRRLRVDSVRGIRDRFPDMLDEVRDADAFKDLYRWTFKFGLDADVGQRVLPTDIAVSLWRLAFSQREPRILKRWLAFLERHPHIRCIPKDTWHMFLNFTEAVGDDLSCYDDTEAWPSLFDDFVEYENDQTNQNVTSDSQEHNDNMM